ncbi:hypothetical protein J2Y86_000905 [Pseudomonas migulae]|uniref:hypothetical protein n=1 Tax=Pseudomonas migulae TaxID=78543 RepID=UPI00209D3BC7|nr:hypothetical protein [Pseudomonas migulae]MCP1496198.1 hypothetical protein [Pseudomonas migulae]
MSNIINFHDFRENQFASRLADILYSAYESKNPQFMKLAIDLCTKARDHGVSDSEIKSVEHQIKA